MKPKTTMDYRVRRHRRIRRRIAGTAERPRMAVMVSNCNMQVQFIDDARGVTLAAASSYGRSLPHNIAGARILGGEAGAAAQKAGITRVVVDRGGLRFHGRVKAIVESAVESGLRIKNQDTKRATREATAADTVETKEDQ